MYAYKTNADALLAELAEIVSSTNLAWLREIITEIEQRIHRFREAQDAPNYSTDHRES
jgi:hypothetical protein